MNRKAKYAINGAIGGSIVSAIFNLIKQKNKMDESPELKFDWSDFTFLFMAIFFRQF